LVETLIFGKGTKILGRH